MAKAFSHFATLFGVGHFPKAPGTMGSLVALILGSVLVHFIDWQVFLVLILAFLVLGVVAADAHEKLTGVHDSPKVVVDELVGMWIVLFPLEAFGAQLGDFRIDGIAAFALFRLFDIWKPWPVSWAETKFTGGFAVMLDDVAAGLMAAAVLMGLGYFI